jgi:hypothetical protein
VSSFLTQQLQFTVPPRLFQVYNLLKLESPYVIGNEASVNQIMDFFNKMPTTGAIKSKVNLLYEVMISGATVEQLETLLSTHSRWEAVEKALKTLGALSVCKVQGDDYTNLFGYAMENLTLKDLPFGTKRKRNLECADELRRKMRPLETISNTYYGLNWTFETLDYDQLLQSEGCVVVNFDYCPFTLQQLLDRLRGSACKFLLVDGKYEGLKPQVNLTITCVSYCYFTNCRIESLDARIMLVYSLVESSVAQTWLGNRNFKHLELRGVF